MAIHPEVAKHLSEIRALAEQYGVARLEIFGSAMTDEFDPEKSDVDFLVHYPDGYDFGYFARRLFDLEDAIADVVQRSVDLVMTSALKKEGFRRSADLTRITIYVGDESVGDIRGHKDTVPAHH